MLTGFAFIAAALKAAAAASLNDIGVHRRSKPKSGRRNPDGRADAGAPYMELCLNHPVHGYYTTRDRSGAVATSSPPPRSAKCSANCSAYGGVSVAPDGTAGNVRLVEIGPGRGTMMLDALRAAHVCRRSALPSCCIWSRSARRCRSASSRPWPRSTCRYVA